MRQLHTIYTNTICIMSSQYIEQRAKSPFGYKSKVRTTRQNQEKGMTGNNSGGETMCSDNRLLQFSKLV